jgi:3',5'-cyclic AMP phosphodiesterase CpdA
MASTLIAHISDPHIVEHPRLCYDTVDTRANLARVLARIEHMRPTPDLVVLTGDLVDEPSTEAYATLRETLAGLSIPLILLPGNHDDRALLAKCLPEHDYLPQGGGKAHFIIDRPGAPLILGFDAVVPGSEHAHVGDDDLDWLARTLNTGPARPTMLMMHHPPVHTGLAFMDAMQPALDPRFESLIGQHRQLQLIVCGHVHRAIDAVFGGARVAVAGSTGFQFEFALDPDTPPRFSLETPSIRLHHWRGNTVTSFTAPLADNWPSFGFPGVDEATWPEMMRRMRGGASRGDVYTPKTTAQR